MDIAEQIYGAIDILVNNKLRSINFNTTIDATIVDASRAKEGRYKVQDETARSFIAYSNQTDYKENDNVLVTIPNGDYTEQKIIVGKKVGDTENTSFKYTSPLSTMIPLVRCTLSGKKREWGIYANQDEMITRPILSWDFSDNPLIGYTRLGLTADFSTWLKELNTAEGSYGIVCTCAFAKNSLAGDVLDQDTLFEEVEENEAFIPDEPYYIKDHDRYQKITLEAFEQGTVYYRNKIKTQAELVAETKLAESTLELESQADSLEFVNFLLDSDLDFYGDVYNFQDYFPQEAIFDISNYVDQKLLYVIVSFYQRQNFKDIKGNYIPAPTFDSTDLKVALLNYKNNTGDEFSAANLTEYYALPDTILTQDEDFVSAVENIYVREPQVILGYNLGDFENDSCFLFSQNSTTYNTTKTDAENAKTIELRWVHDFNGTIKDVTRTEFWSDKLKDYNIRWYRHKLGAPTPDQYTGVYWELIKNYKYDSNIAAADIEPIFQLDIIPDTSLDYEEFKVIIVKNYTTIAESNAIFFYNEQTTENMTQTDKSNALSIACGHPKNDPEALMQDRFVKDSYQGMFFIYKKGNSLIDDSKANEKLFLTPVFNSVKTEYEQEQNSVYNAGDIQILSDASVIIWSFPASNTMLRPIAKESSNSNEVFILAKDASVEIISDADYINYPYFENKNCYRSLIMHYETGSIQTKIFYNRTLDTLEFVHIITSGDNPDGQVNLSIDDCGIIQPYYISKTYTPSAVNNTIGLEVIKDRIRYSASKTMYFGQAGTSGSDYTLVVGFKNNQNAVCIQDDENGYAADYFGDGNDTYNALIASVRLIGQDGKDAIDFNNIAASDSYTVTFEIAESQINGYTDSNYRSTQKEKSRIYYPVSFSGQPSRKEDGSDKNYQDFSNPAHAEFSDGIAIAQYMIDDGDWDAERDWSKYYYFSLDTLSDPDPAETKAGTFFALEESPVDVPHAENYQYYRQLDLDNDNIALREQPKDKITYKLCEAMDAALYAQLDGPMFINYSGVYVLDPFFDNTGYNEAQDYYYPVLAEDRVDTYPVLQIETQSPYAGSIVFNPWHECLIHLDSQYWTSATVNWTEEHERPSAEDIMNSVTILKVTLSGFGDYDLVTYVPIPLRRVLFNNDNIVDWVQSIVGATEIRYSSSGEIPDYYKNPYVAKVINNGVIEENKSNNWVMICPLDSAANSNFKPTLKTYEENSVQRCILSPLSVYIPNAPLFGVAFKPNGVTLWSQPILVYQDNYPSATINAWDGKSVTTDEDTGSILSSAIAAGKKTNNKFSGVMLGDWSRSDTDASVSKQTGLYGFHEGSMSFAFKEDGTAFIGKDGYGRIHLAGNKAQIYSSSWILGQQGMLLDLNKGSMKLVQKSNYSAKTFNNKVTYDAFITDNNNALYEFSTYRPLTIQERSPAPTSLEFYIPNDLIIQSINVLDDDLIIPNFYYYFYYVTESEPVLTQWEDEIKPVHKAGIFSNENAPDILNKEIQIKYLTCTKVKGKIDQENGNALVEDETGNIWCCKAELSVVHKVMIMRDSGLQTIADLKELLNKMIDPEDVTHYVGTENVSIRIAKNYMRLQADNSNTKYQYQYQFGRDPDYRIVTVTKTYVPSQLVSGDRPVFKFYSNYVKIVNNTNQVYPTVNGTALDMYVPYNPNFTYYVKDEASEFGDSRYVTVSAAETIYPLAIGAQSSVGQRPFRVRWDGNVYIEDGVFTGTITATGGAITGNLDVSGTLTGGSFYTGYLEAYEGKIGGWNIDHSSLYGGDISQGKRTILSSINGITTHTITINTNAPPLNNPTGTSTSQDIGSIGLFRGATTDGENVVTTYNIGMTSVSGRSILLESGENLRLSGLNNTLAKAIYLDGQEVFIGGSGHKIDNFAVVLQRDTKTASSMVLPSVNSTYVFRVGLWNTGDPDDNDNPTYYFNGKPALYTNIPAENQYGIYARFA